jgi:hypothetical protein
MVFTLLSLHHDSMKNVLVALACAEGFVIAASPSTDAAASHRLNLYEGDSTVTHCGSCKSWKNGWDCPKCSSNFNCWIAGGGFVALDGRVYDGIWFPGVRR